MEYPNGRMIQFGGIKHFVIQCVNILLSLENKKLYFHSLLLICYFLVAMFSCSSEKKQRIVFVATTVAHLLVPGGFIEQLQEKTIFKWPHDWNKITTLFLFKKVVFQVLKLEVIFLNDTQIDNFLMSYCVSCIFGNTNHS